MSNQCQRTKETWKSGRTDNDKGQNKKMSNVALNYGVLEEWNIGIIKK